MLVPLACIIFCGHACAQEVNEDLEPIDESFTQSSLATTDIPFDEIAGGLYDSPPNDPLASLDTVLIAVYIIVTVLGLTANVIVFFIIFAGNEIGKSVTITYVLQLTIADTVFLLTLPIFSMQKLNEYNTWNFGEGMCTISHTIKYCNYYAGMFFLTAMSVDRYIAIKYSARLNQIRTKTKTYVICGLVWALACIMSIPIMLYARVETWKGMKHCRIMFPGYNGEVSNRTIFVLNRTSDEEADYGYIFDFPGFGNQSFTEDDVFDGETTDDYKFYPCSFQFQSHVYKVWLVFDALIAFFIPFGVIVLMYSMIMLRMRKVEHNISRNHRGGGHRQKRITKLVAALVLCFAFCWLPQHILTLARIPGFQSSPLVCHALEEFFTALAFSNSALNPILYTFLGFKFKDRFKTSVRNVRSIVKRQGSREHSYHRTSRNNDDEEVTRRDTTVL